MSNSFTLPPNIQLSQTFSLEEVCWSSWYFYFTLYLTDNLPFSWVKLLTLNIFSKVHRSHQRKYELHFVIWYTLAWLSFILTYRLLNWNVIIQSRLKAEVIKMRICMSTRSICLSTRSTRGTISRSFYNWSFMKRPTVITTGKTSTTSGQMSTKIGEASTRSRETSTTSG